jgi:hypothetical protein
MFAHSPRHARRCSIAPTPSTSYGSTASATRVPCSSKTERREFGMHSPHTHAAQTRVAVALSMFLSARPTHGAGKTVRPAWPGKTHSIVHLAVDRRQRGGCLTLPGRLLDDRCRLLCRRLLALRVGCHYGVEVRGSSWSALLKFQGGDTTAAATFGRPRRRVEVAPGGQRTAVGVDARWLPQ